jgi:hypothetical protein
MILRKNLKKWWLVVVVMVVMRRRGRIRVVKEKGDGGGHGC